MTNNSLAFFIYQLIILWTISINWHRWLLVDNPISKYNSFILDLYRRYINYVPVCPPPPPLPPTHTRNVDSRYSVHSWCDGSSDRSLMVDPLTVSSTNLLITQLQPHYSGPPGCGEDPSSYWAISRSSQSSTTGVTKAVVLTILSVG